ncbi:MAG: O-antigen ligase family protein [Candidatus Eremiobacteraeota bacterium]|nr:O-antigen ligase family protein [Candidatus Eremiobacteraeota bacterium]
MLAAKPSSPPAARPRNVERWLLFVALLATAIFPALSKYQPATDANVSSPVAQWVWSVLYLAAFVRLSRMWPELKPLLTRSLGLCVFVALMFLSMVWSTAPYVTMYNAIELIGTTVIAYYIVARFTLAEFLEILALAFGTIAILSLAFVFGAPGHGRMDWGTGAWSGIYQDKNNLGASMALGVISLVMLLVQAKQRARFLILGVLGVCVVLLFGSNSATAFADCLVACMAALAALACRSRRIGGVSRVVTGIAIVVVVIAVSIFGFSFDGIFEMLGRGTTLTGRTDFWPYLNQAIADRPLLGYGYNAFFRSFAGENYLSSYVVEAGGWSPYHAHNSFLQICLDAGYVGLALLLYALAVGFWRALVFLGRERGNVAAWPLAILLYLVLGSFTETYLGNYNTFEWIFFVAAILYPLKSRAPEAVRSFANRKRFR